MGAGEVLVGGTAYNIIGGKTKIAGTGYDITGGKTKVGGTDYTISFASPREQTIPALMANATKVASAGRNSSTNSTVEIANANIPSGISYVLSFCEGYMSATKVTKASSDATPTITLIAQTSTRKGNVTVNNSDLRYASSFGSNGFTSVAGATLFLLTFGGGYTDTEICDIFGSLTRLAGNGRNSTSTGYVYLSKSSGYFFVAYNTYMAFSYGDASTNSTTAIYGNHSTNPSLMYRYVSSSNDRWYLSTNGTSRASVYGGTIVKVIDG